VYASGLYDPEQLAFDGSNNLYVAQNWSGYVAKIAPPSGSGQPIVTKYFAKTPYYYANGLAVDPSGNIYVHSNDQNAVNSAVTKITPAASLSTYSNVKGYGDMKFDDVGNLYTTSGNGISIIDPTGKVSILDTGMTFNEPQGLAFDKEKKTLYLTTKGTNPSLYKIDLTKIIQTKNTGLLYVWYAYTNVPVAYEAWVNDSLLNEHNQSNNPFWTNEIKAIDLKSSTQITTTTTPTGSKISIPRGSYLKGMKVDITVTGFVQAWTTVNFNYSCSVNACTAGQAWSSTPGVTVSVDLTP
jgi:sugar lactone lactonase YvrE